MPITEAQLTHVLKLEPSDALQGIMEEAQAAGMAASSGEGGGKRSNMMGRMSKMSKQGTKMVSAGLKKSGVSFGISSLLKQAQVFTGFFGALFQILGGFLDVLLAPLIPILMPILVFLARMIPVVGKIAQIVLGPIVFVIELVMKIILWLQGIILNVFQAHIENIMELFDGVKSKFEDAWNHIKNGEWMEAFQDILSGLWSLLVLPFEAGWNTLRDGIAGAWDWLLQFELVQNLRDWWNGFWGGTFMGWVASIWNPIVDIMQFLQDKVVEGINAISPFTDIVSGSLEGWKIKTDQTAPGAGASAIAGATGSAAFGDLNINILGLPPQMEVEVSHDEDKKEEKKRRSFWSRGPW